MEYVRHNISRGLLLTITFNVVTISLATTLSNIQIKPHDHKLSSLTKYYFEFPYIMRFYKLGLQKYLEIQFHPFLTKNI